MQNEGSTSNWRERLQEWFPDREFFMRSQGQVRFITITSRMQKIAATTVVALVIGWSVTMAAMAWSKYQADVDRLSLLENAAKVASAQERLDTYGDDLDAVAQDLTKRQDFIEQMTEVLPADVKDVSGTVTDSTSEATEMIQKVSASFPEAAALARIEARQIAYVERVTRFADDRALRAEEALRKLGLDPKAMVRDSDLDAMGGPLELLATSADGSIDPRFERLGLSLARMAALERGLDSIPQFLPTNLALTKLSSGFGYRRDPFTGGGAMHSGLDFKGPTGSPIFAAAKGTVSFAGRKSGYGKVIEIKHGNGMMTRYAHMSRLEATIGQPVAAGDVIGALGSTGRSTGPHLHFEVRINNRAVNPRPFLETAPHVLKEARGTHTTRTAAK
ncbi:MAG: peptidoglycan DD-metalloendopeptidase family protein [Pseudomonadota bacterium]